MVAYLKATLDDIIADAKENDRVEYLKSLAKKTFKTEEGTKRKITFMELKRNYYTTYYKEMLPVAKKKAPTMFDKIDEL